MASTRRLAPAAASRPRRRARPRLLGRGDGGRRALAGVLFVAPASALVAAFFVAPLLLAVWMSVHDWPLIGPARLNGASNYRAIPHQREFVSSIWFTIRYTVVITVALTLLAFGLALLVQRPRRGTGVLRAAYFLPAMIGLAVASLLWYVLANQQVGAFSAVLQALGWPTGRWISWARPPGRCGRRWR